MKENNAVEVLLIEDLEEDANLCLRSLTKNKLVNDVKWIEDGEEALEYLFATGKYSNRSLSHQPKIILLDLKMPKISGLEILQKIRKHEGFRHIPVIVLTSSKESKDIDKAYELGANSYIVKPVDFQKFVEVIREIGFYWLVLNEQP